MFTRSNIPVYFVAALLSLSSIASAQRTVMKEVSTTDPGVTMAADFAVKEQSTKSKKAVKLDSILKAEDGEAALGARSLRLCLKTDVNGKSITGQALVSMDKYSNLKLVRWTAPYKCGGAASASSDVFKDVAADHPGAGLAADFAVKQHSADTKIEHTLVAVRKAATKGTFSTTYKVCMVVSEDGKEQPIEAVVSMDKYSNMKLISWKHAECGN